MRQVGSDKERESGQGGHSLVVEEVEPQVRKPPLYQVVLLNDDIADGRDISWIWDVDFELLQGRVRSLGVSGRRAWDMALRLKYAGVSESPDVEHSMALALKRALDATPEGETLVVIPTYTAMLEVRNILGRWSGRGAFWEGDAK